MSEIMDLPVNIIRSIAALPDNAGLRTQVLGKLIDDGIVKAVTDHDNKRLYSSLMGAFQYQGISDAIADAYVATNGTVDYLGVERTLLRSNRLCQKLSHFDEFRNCGYTKSRQTCGNPSKFSRCPLPKWPMRKGPLNQTAYSLFLFIRDRCDGDLVGFIDKTLRDADEPDHPDRVAKMAAALFDAMASVFGISSKLIGMAFSDLLMCAAARQSG